MHKVLVATTTLLAFAQQSTAQNVQADTDPGFGTGTTITTTGTTTTVTDGEKEGGNLFHSFAEFDLISTGNAIFTRSSADAGSISNIISRVRSGTVSNIAGIVANSDMPNGGFILTNPAGLSFNNATLNLANDVVFSTAHELRFAAGPTFSTITPDGSTFSSAAPLTLGGLGGQQNITVNGLTLGAGMTSFMLGGANVSLGGNITTNATPFTVAAFGNGAVNVLLASPETSGGIGTITLNNGLMFSGSNDLDGTVKLFGEVTNNADLDVTGAMTLTGDLTNTNRLDVGATISMGGHGIENSGILNIESGGALSNSGLLNNLATGTFTVQSNGSAGAVTNAGTGANAGTIASLVNSNSFTIETTGNVTGTTTNTSDLNINGGTLGTLDNNTGGDVDVTGGGTVNTAITNAATLDINSGTLTVTGNGTTNESGGTLTIASGATLASKTTNNAGATLSVIGTVSGNAINAGTASIASTGDVTGTVTNTSDLNINGGTLGTLDNNAGGDVDVTGGGSVDTAITNAAALDINSGTLTVAGNGTTNESGGTLTVASGATLASDITNSVGATLSTTGTVTGALVNSSIVNASGALSGAIANLGSANFNVTGMLSANNSFNNSGSATLDVTGGSFTGISTLTNTSAITVSAGNTLAANVINNTAGSILLTSATLSGAVNNFAMISAANSTFMGLVTNAGNIRVNGSVLMNGGLSNSGTVSMANASTSDVLTVNGALGGSGTYAIDAVLDASEASDKIIVNGSVDASSQNTLLVVNQGGLGAETGAGDTDGILVVDVDGTSSTDNFKIAGDHVVAGEFIYGLHHSSTGDFYLQSRNLPTSTLLSPSSSEIAFSAQTSLMNLPFNMGTPDNLGSANTRISTSGQTRQTLAPWVRILGSRGSFESALSRGGLTERTKSRLTYAGLQIGHGFELDTSNAGTTTLQLAAHRYRTTQNVERIGAFTGLIGQTEGKAYGVTGGVSYILPSRAYVNAALTFSMLDFDFSTTVGATGKTAGRSLGFALEAGKPIEIGRGNILTPWAKLQQDVAWIEGFSDSRGTTQGAYSSRHTAATFGLNAEHRFATANGISSLSGGLSVVHTIGSAADVVVSGIAVSHRRANKTQFQLDLGANWQSNDGKTRMSVGVGGSRTLNGSSDYTLQAKVDLTIRF